MLLTQVKKNVNLILIGDIFITSGGEEVEIIDIQRPINGFVLIKWRGGYGLFDNRAELNIRQK